MYKVFVYRLYPSKVQIERLGHLLEIARAFYNAALQERKEAWQKQGISLNYYDQANQLAEIKAANPEYALLNYNATQDILRRLDKSFKDFFRRMKHGEKPGYPRFKGKDRFDSITFPKHGNGLILREKERRISVRNVGEIKIKMHRPIGDHIKIACLKRSKGYWYVIFHCDAGEAPIPKNNFCNPMGIDMGLESFAALSDGTIINNPQYGKQGSELIADRQRKLTTKKRGSKNRTKARLSMSRAYGKVHNQRKDFIHKTAKQLVQTYDFIAYEKLTIKRLMHNHCVAGAISDASWAEFLRVLRCKAEEAGVATIGVKPYGTSQRCSRCGTKVPKDLSIRIHTCPICGLVLHRDVNASRNTLALGLSAWAKTQEAVAPS